MHKLVSIVIPTYNRANDLKRAIDSIYAQTYTNWEVLVVDNHSDDNTDEVIASYNDKRISLFKVHNNGVIAVSRNKGISEAKGEFVALLDSDDWWLNDKLERSVAALESGFDFVYHDLFLVFKTEQKRMWRTGFSRKVTDDVFNDLILNGNPISNSSVVVRTHLLRQIGGLSEDPEMIAMEDFDAWLRISKLTNKFNKLDKVYGYYWMGGGNVSSAERSIKVLNKFTTSYKSNIDELPHQPWWIIYGYARAYFLLKEYDQSRDALRSLRLVRRPFLIVVKSVWMIVQMIIKS